ncbi:MAG: glycoside hydrolase family 43 protein [Ruminococcaceae bacterium]|nr:glycoside hydrolase family 43 protein [Oscillospiraceae bacterium]
MIFGDIMKKTLSILLSFVLLVSSLSLSFNVNAKDAYSDNSISRVCLHDPSVFKAENGSYYAVGSHLAMAKSNDLINWNSLDSSIDSVNYLTNSDKSWKENLAEPLSWTTNYQLAVGIPENEISYSNWANNIIYNKTMKKYCLYGCCSVWGTTVSVIWLAVSDSVEGPYEYVDSFVYSGITAYQKAQDKDYLDEGQKEYARIMDYSNTNMQELIDSGYMSESKILTNPSEPAYSFVDWNGYYTNIGPGGYPNAIDPTAFTDAMGEMWLVYGSFSGGCFVLKLDNETGLPDYSYMNKNSSYNIYFGKRISNTNDETEVTGEGPFIIYDKQSRYYYFFLTYGGLGAADGYNIREYRSKRPDGPYEDAAGNLATDFVNTGLKISGNYQLDSMKSAYLSPGHSSCLIDSDGKMYQAFHTRFTADNGFGHQVRIHQMARTSDGWAVLLPFEYQGEKLSAVSKSNIPGTYEYIDLNNMTQHKQTEDSPWSDIILPKQYITLKADGTITNIKDYSCSLTNSHLSSKSVSGKWSLSSSGINASFTIGGVNYNGVFAYQKDGSASGKKVLTFVAAGNDNSTIMGVKHTHTYKTTVTPATLKANGKTVKKCSVCKMTLSTTIYKPKTFKLSKTSYTYDGKAKKPSVTIKDTKGKTIAKSNYTVSYSSNKKVGTAKVKIKFKNNYKGSKTRTFKIKKKKK